MQVNVIYEDNHLLVIEKPANMPSQKDSSNDPDVLSEMKEYVKIKYNKPGDVYLGLVHRLDRPVGGVMVLARTSKAASRLSDQIRKREFYKAYLAVIHGKLEQTGKLEHYLLKNEETNTVTVVDKNTPGSKEAILEFETISFKDDMSLVKVNLHTGRPHQIRVQFSEIGHAISGDMKYGIDNNPAKSQIALWSAEITFKHPVKDDQVSFRSHPPDIYPWTLFM